jgi:photosystem II stability/assembly factor-like uncharacterized protein
MPMPIRSDRNLFVPAVKEWGAPIFNRPPAPKPRAEPPSSKRASRAPGGEPPPSELCSQVTAPATDETWRWRPGPRYRHRTGHRGTRGCVWHVASVLTAIGAMLCGSGRSFGDPSDAPTYRWVKLDTSTNRGKQDDGWFIDPSVGWYVNGSGRVHGTRDAGETWKELARHEGSFFRCIAFLDDQHGFVGNLGTGYFPAVTDETPLYRTVDGGATLEPVAEFRGPTPRGLCAIEVVREGDAGAQSVVYAAGRVGGPAFFLASADQGRTWASSDMNEMCAMILDLKFFNRREGIACAATSTDLSKSNGLILGTLDGGVTWTRRWQSGRPFELTWKASFPTRSVGYVTLQSYDPAPSASKRYIVKTTNGGKNWSELLLADDLACRPFGVGFIDERSGWVGAVPHGFETRDGGGTWTRADIGPATNKFRFVGSGRSASGYAIGPEIYKLLIER